MEPILYSEGFPIETILRLYLKHSRRFYLNYFEEFKLLRDYLSPISKPLNLSPNPKLHIFISYEIQELARHLGLDSTVLIQILLHMNSYTRDSNHGPET